MRLSGARDRLSPSNAHSIGNVASGDISYIYQNNFGKHYLNVTGGFQCNYVDLVDEKFYNVFAAKAALVWQYQWFCLSFIAHLFDNQTIRSGYQDYSLYYNLRLTPIFTLRKQWSISANLMFNSVLVSKYITEGDYFYSSLRVSKKIGKWSIHAELSDPFHYRTSDKYYIVEADDSTPVLVSRKKYYPYQQYLNLGVMYEF